MKSKQIFFEHSTALGPLPDTHKTLPLREGLPLIVLFEEGKSGYPMVLPGEKTRAIWRDIWMLNAVIQQNHERVCHQ